MTKRTRRNHSATFKAKVALAALKGEKTISQFAEQFDVHASQITQWKEQLQVGAVDIFDAGPGVKAEKVSIDIKTLHAKIGELTLENDFLESALSNAGLRSAKR